MAKSKPPPELSELREADFAMIRPNLEMLTEEPENEALADVLGALLRDRCLLLLRRGSRLDLSDEAMYLADFLESEAGERLRKTRPDVHGSWCAVDDLLAEAARRSDRTAVDSILLSHRGRGQKVLELLAARENPVRRSDIRQALGEISDSLVSHLLRDLEEADLIGRFRPPRSKEVMVELGPAGRDVVGREILPGWAAYLADRLNELAGPQSVTFDPAEIRQGLLDHGAPTALVAERLAEALIRLAPVEVEPDWLQKVMKTEDDGRIGSLDSRPLGRLVPKPQEQAPA